MGCAAWNVASENGEAVTPSRFTDLVTPEASSALSAFEVRVRNEALEEAACAAERVDETYSDGMKMYGRSNYASARNDAARLIRALKTKKEPGNG
jgi:hypothetical protein